MLNSRIATKALVALVAVALGVGMAGLLSADHPSPTKSGDTYSLVASPQHKSSSDGITPHVQKVRETCTATCGTPLDTSTGSGGGSSATTGGTVGTPPGGNGSVPPPPPPPPPLHPSAVASPSSGTTGTVVTLSGTGFAPASLQRGTILVRFASGQNPSVGSATVSPTGALGGTITVNPGDATGPNPIDILETYACGVVICHTGTAASFSVTVPVTYTYDGQVGGWHQIPLQKVTNESIEDLPDATKVGTLVFTTSDPYYRALNGATLNVWRAPNEFPGELVVHNGDQGPQPVYGTWVYTPFYALTWQGTWTPMRLTTNVSVEDLSDAHLEGPGANFETDDPYYVALNGSTINVWQAQAEFGNELVAHNGNQGPQPVYGTWILS
jgi:hypothetical protein